MGYKLLTIKNIT